MSCSTSAKFHVATISNATNAGLSMALTTSLKFKNPDLGLGAAFPWYFAIFEPDMKVSWPLEARPVSDSVTITLEHRMSRVVRQAKRNSPTVLTALLGFFSGNTLVVGLSPVWYYLRCYRAVKSTPCAINAVAVGLV